MSYSVSIINGVTGQSSVAKKILTDRLLLWVTNFLDSNLKEKIHEFYLMHVIFMITK